MTDEPRLLTRAQAAAMCGIALSTFSLWVTRGTMPPAVPGTRRWDKEAIGDKLDALRGPQAKQAVDPFEEWERGYRAKQAARATYKPQLPLRSQQQRVLMFMAKRPDCNTVDAIPGAGERTMQILIEAGAVYRSGERYLLTRLGRDEAARLGVWLAQD